MAGGIWELLGALGPVFALIALGYGLHRYQIPGGDFWSGAERLTYFVLFPALLLSRLAATPMSIAGLWRLALAAGLLTGAMSVLLLVLRRQLAPMGPPLARCTRARCASILTWAWLPPRPSMDLQAWPRRPC